MKLIKKKYGMKT